MVNRRRESNEGMQESPIWEENQGYQGENGKETPCKLCGLTEQPISKSHTPRKAKRTRKPSLKAANKERKENWIACCVCCNWFHIRCVGITKVEKQKLKGKAFYKCICCCFDVAKSFKESLESTLNIEIFNLEKKSLQPATAKESISLNDVAQSFKLSLESALGIQIPPSLEVSGSISCFSYSKNSVFPPTGPSLSRPRLHQVQPIWIQYACVCLERNTISHTPKCCFFS